jgi:hypothetical protein
MSNSMKILKVAHRHHCEDCCPDVRMIEFKPRVESFNEIVGTHPVHNNRMHDIIREIRVLLSNLYYLDYSTKRKIDMALNYVTNEDFAKNIINKERFEGIKEAIKSQTTNEDTARYIAAQSEPYNKPFKLLSNSPKWSNLILSLLAYAGYDEKHPLVKMFNDRGVSKMDELELVISTDPHRIVGMSAFGQFTSCQDWIKKERGHEYHNYTHKAWANLKDVSVGIMYIRNKEDDQPTEDDHDVQDMLARSLIRIAELPNGRKVLYLHRIYAEAPYNKYIEDTIAAWEKTLPEEYFVIHAYKHDKGDYRTGKNKFGVEYSGYESYTPHKHSCGVDEGSSDCECDVCDGQGHTECGCCEGSGTVYTYDRNDNEYENECRECDGNGTRECEHCDGEGRFENDGDTVYPYNDHTSWIDTETYRGVTFQIPEYIMKWDVEPVVVEAPQPVATMDGNTLVLWNTEKMAVGTVVQIRTDLVEGNQIYYMHNNSYKGNCVNDAMMALQGQFATITGMNYTGTQYQIDLDNGNWCWTDEMFNVEYKTQPMGVANNA